MILLVRVLALRNLKRELYMLTFDELNKAELMPYAKERYERIRESLHNAMSYAEDAMIQASYKASIHLSYCVQNLHKNFDAKLKDLLAFYNKQNGKLPTEIFFEPSFPKVFPPPPRSDDDLPILNKTLIHHAEYYDMKSMAVTWKNLIEQYLSCIEYAINTQDHAVLNACVKASSDGCFDNCISEMGIWKAGRESIKNDHSSSRMRI